METGSNKRDLAVSITKGALGAFPFIGPMVAEVVGTLIPNQRIDRIEKLLRALNEKVEAFDHETTRAKFTELGFIDLFEDGMYQAARALSDERIDYIASLLKNNLTDEQIEYVESKHLLRILGEVNDIEIIWLRYHWDQMQNSDKEFRQKHRHVLKPALASVGSSPAEHHKATLQDSYKEHLAQLGLLERRFETDRDTRRPKFDSVTGALRVRGYEMTRLGALLLQEVSLLPTTP